MKNQVIHMDKDRGREQAEGYFREMCGYNRGKPASEKIISKSLKSLEDIYDQINIKVLISEYDTFRIAENGIFIDKELFACSAAELLPTGEIEKIYVYLMTTGQLNVQDSSLLRLVYHDLWQNAYLDSGQEQLRDYLQGFDCNCGKYVSGNFGPGYFGMDISQLKKFFAVLDGAKIGVSLLESGFMAPSKSYAGFFLVTGSKSDFDGMDCNSCISSGKTCMYCKAGRSMI